MNTCFAWGCDTFVGCGLHESILVLYIYMYESMPVLYYLPVCVHVPIRMYIHCTYTCNMLLATLGSTGRCHTFCNLFTLQLMCEKDVGMGLCTFNFVLRLSLHLVCLLFGTSSLHLFEFF